MKNKSKSNGFLRLPNSLLDEILRSDLSATQLKVLLLCLRWTIGYRKETCKPSLTALSNCTGHSRQFLSRVIKKLVDKNFLRLVTPAGFKKPAQYKVILNYDSHTATGHSANFEARGLEQDLYSESNSRMIGCHAPVRQGVILEDNGESYCRGHYIDSFHRKRVHTNSFIENPPSPLKKGELRIEKTDSEQRTQEDAILPSASKGVSPPGPPKQKASIKSLIRYLNETYGIDASLTRTELRECCELADRCNPSVYQAAFIRLVEKAKGAPLPAHLKHSGDVNMLFARSAAREAKGYQQ